MTRPTGEDARKEIHSHLLEPEGMPIKELEQVTQLAYKLMVDNSPRNIAFDAYMQMYKSGWELPKEIRMLPWIQAVINSDPYDAIQTGVRIIATLPPSIRFQPLAPGPDNAKAAGKIEKVLKWQLKSANRRRSRTVEYELAKMALLYDMCAVRVVDLEEEIKQKRIINASTAREEQALAKGRFMIVPYDSRDVHPVWSNIGLEGVLGGQHRRAQEIIDEFGDKAKKFPNLVKLATEPHDKDWVTYYDYVDHDTRCIWVDEGRTFTTPKASDQARYVIDHGRNPTGIIPWSIKGGSELDTDPMHRFQPLLYPVYATGAWDIKNIVQTLGVSEVIAHTGSPRYVEEGPNQQVADIDYFSPERIAKMPAGNILKALAPPAMDNALQNVEAMLSAQLDKSTVASILQGGDLPAGVAFASLNLITQTAIGVLTPAKDLAQKTLAGMFEVMLELVIYSKKAVYGFDTKGDTDGTELSIDPEALDRASIYIDVDLHADSPTDKAQKVNTAGVMVQQLGLSQESALEEVGFEDPQEELKKGIFERFTMHEVDMMLEQERLQLQNAMEAERMMMQMEMEERRMQLQEEQMARQAEQQAALQQEAAAAQGGGGGAGGAMMPADLAAMGGPGQAPGGQAGAMAPPGQVPPEGMPQVPFAQGAPAENAEGAGNPAVTGGGF
jgi:hypothetical protein